MSIKMESYEEMLKELYSKLPSKIKRKERFEMPEVVSYIEGKKTIFKNFSSIAQKIRRREEMFAKFLSKELGVPVKKEGSVLVLQRKINNRLLQQKVNIFIKEYVICLECNRPDTNIRGEGVKMLVCEACGARRPIK